MKLPLTCYWDDVIRQSQSLKAMIYQRLTKINGEHRDAIHEQYKPGQPSNSFPDSAWLQIRSGWFNVASRSNWIFFPIFIGFLVDL